MLQKIVKLLDKVALFFSVIYLKKSSQLKKESIYLNERSIEYSFVLDTLLKHKVLSVLDIGTGTNSFASTLEHCGYNVTASDLKGNYWKSFINRHIYVIENDITNSKIKHGSYDAITCISTLEHIEDYNSAVEEMTKIVKKDGLIIMSFPYKYDNFCENIYQLDTADNLAKSFRYIARSYSDKEIKNWCDNFGLELVESIYVRGWEGDFWRSGKRISFPYKVSNKKEANCICLSVKNKVI